MRGGEGGVLLWEVEVRGGAGGGLGSREEFAFWWHGAWRVEVVGIRVKVVVLGGGRRRRTRGGCGGRGR